MPYVNANLTQKLTPKEAELLKSEIGKIIGLIGKSEQHLMVDIESGKTIYFKGKPENCAYVDVRIYGSCDFDRKNKFIGALSEVVEKVAGVKKDNVFVSFLEFTNWGMNGGLI